MMYVDVVRVTVRLLRTADDSFGLVTLDESSTVLPLEGVSIDLGDELRDDVQGYVFDRSVELGAGGYSVAFTEKRVEHGASTTLAEVVVEIMDAAKSAGWQALATLVAGYLVERLRPTDRDD